jgi:hypothetical protein
MVATAFAARSFAHDETCSLPEEPWRLTSAVDDAYVSPYHRIMRTTVTLDDDIYEAAVANAKATGRRLGEVLSEMARTALEPRQPSSGRRRRARFAAFEVPKGSRMISASKIQKVLDDEGIV